MNKIFIVAGELSGDKVAAWYVNHLKQTHPNIHVDAVGGNYLEAAGAQIYERFESLNVVGVFEILKHLRSLNAFMKKLVAHICANDYDAVVVVDFPGFNLRLIKQLKNIKPTLRIEYVAPPQLWAWGEWRLKTIKNFCDRVVVMYPFEVEWYARRGVNAEWLGYPFYKKFEPYFAHAAHKTKTIAIVPGSREQEVRSFLPMLVRIVKNIKLADTYAQVVLPLADSIKRSDVERMFRDCGLQRWRSDITIVQGEKEILQALSKCCVAVTKPGTVSLELALLGVPAVVMYKTSWLTYLIARPLVSIKYMALPNLLLGYEIYPEFIQHRCTVDNVWGAVLSLYKKFQANHPDYSATVEKLAQVRELLRG